MNWPQMTPRTPAIAGFAEQLLAREAMSRKPLSRLPAELVRSPLAAVWGLHAMGRRPLVGGQDVYTRHRHADLLGERIDGRVGQ